MYLNDVVGHRTDVAAVLSHRLLSVIPHFLCFLQDTPDVSHQLMLETQQRVTYNVHTFIHSSCFWLPDATFTVYSYIFNSMLKTVPFTAHNE